MGILQEWNKAIDPIIGGEVPKEKMPHQLMEVAETTVLTLFLENEPEVYVSSDLDREVMVNSLRWGGYEKEWIENYEGFISLTLFRIFRFM